MAPTLNVLVGVPLSFCLPRAIFSLLPVLVAVLMVTFPGKARHHYHNLSLGLGGPEMFEHAGDAAAAMLFVQLGNLAGDGAFALRAEDLGKLFQRLDETPG